MTCRLLRQARRITTTCDPVVPFAIMLTFKTFCDWIRKELEDELERRWYVEMSGVGGPKYMAR